MIKMIDIQIESDCFVDIERAMDVLKCMIEEAHRTNDEARKEMLLAKAKFIKTLFPTNDSLNGFLDELRDLVRNGCTVSN